MDYLANKKSPGASSSENAWLWDKIWCAWAEIIQRHMVCLKTSVMEGGGGGRVVEEGRQNKGTAALCDERPWKNLAVKYVNVD